MHQGPVHFPSSADQVSSVGPLAELPLAVCVYVFFGSARASC